MTELSQNISVNRKYKDTLFRKLFSDPEDLLSLYNAVNGTQYEDASKLEITTIESVIYMHMKNDVSFLISQEMNLFEHQSTVNPNMPVRGLFYFSSLYKAYIGKNQYDIYRSTQVNLPFPRYVVFYNGTNEMPDRWKLRLSDSFEGNHDEEPSLECVAQVLNINYGHNQELLGACRMLQDYSLFISWIRSYMSAGYGMEMAVDLAINRAIDEDVLRDYLRKHKEEARMDILEEFDLEFHLKNERTIAYEEGRAEGFIASVQSLMKAQTMTAEEAVTILVPEDLRADVLSKVENQA